MPYLVERVEGDSRPWKVVKKGSGKVVGSSKTKDKAEAMVRAMYANENTLRHGLRQMKEGSR